MNLKQKPHTILALSSNYFYIENVNFLKKHTLITISSKFLFRFKN